MRYEYHLSYRILQKHVLNFIFSFFQTMGRVSMLLEAVFCNPRVLKIGWGFESNDNSMIRMVCNGYFSGKPT